MLPCRAGQTPISKHGPVTACGVDGGEKRRIRLAHGNSTLSNNILDSVASRPVAHRLTMADWARPQHSRRSVNGAGAQLVDATVLTPSQPMEIINNWRSSHRFPLNTLQNTTRRYGRTVDPDVLVAQRIKRLPAITAKLKNEPWLKLSQMQDIGGCRGVVSSVEQASQLVKAFVNSKMKHQLLRQDDYITTPRASGYRSHHLVYKYYSDHSDYCNDLRIEVQIRSQLQHVWATAVETVSAFTGQALKASHGGDDWRRFFALMVAKWRYARGLLL